MPFTCYKAVWAISWPRNRRGGKVRWLRTLLFPFSRRPCLLENTGWRSVKKKDLQRECSLCCSNLGPFLCSRYFFSFPDLKFAQIWTEKLTPQHQHLALSKSHWRKKMVTWLWEVRDLKESIMFKVYTMDIWAIFLHFPVKLRQSQILHRETNQSSRGRDRNFDI